MQQTWTAVDDYFRVRRFTELVAEHPELTATAVQTVGEKGYDGFVLALVTD